MIIPAGGRIVFLVAVVLFAAAGAFYYRRHLLIRDEARRLQQENFATAVGKYDVYHTTQADIVMLGTSLTANAEWAELLGRKDVVNRGVGSDITSGFLSRIGYILRLHPKICFIEGGVNDVFNGIEPNEIFSSIMKIIDTLKEAGITPVIQTAPFAAPPIQDASAINGKLRALNDRLRAYADSSAAEFIDLNALLASNEQLNPGLTPDGLHLNGRGYAIWGEAVEAILARHKL